MTVAYRGPHDLGSVIRNSYGLYAANFRTLFLIGLITAPLNMLLVVLQRQVSSDEADALIAVGMQLAMLLVALVANAALIHAIHAISGGGDAEAGASIDAGFGHFTALLTTNLLQTALCIASLVAFPALAIWWAVNRQATIDGRRDWWLVFPLVLTVYLLLRWVMVPQAVVIGGKRRWSALDASAETIRGEWWRVLGILMVASLLVVGPFLIVTAAAALPIAAEAVISGAAGALTLPFFAVAQTLLYYDLRSRRNAHATSGA